MKKRIFTATSKADLERCFPVIDLTPETLPGSFEETPRRLGYELSRKFVWS